MGKTNKNHKLLYISFALISALSAAETHQNNAGAAMNATAESQAPEINSSKITCTASLLGGENKSISFEPDKWDSLEQVLGETFGQDACLLVSLGKNPIISQSFGLLVKLEIRDIKSNDHLTIIKQPCWKVVRGRTS